MTTLLSGCLRSLALRLVHTLRSIGIKLGDRVLSIRRFRLSFNVSRPRAVLTMNLTTRTLSRTGNSLRLSGSSFALLVSVSSSSTGALLHTSTPRLLCVSKLVSSSVSSSSTLLFQFRACRTRCLPSSRSSQSLVNWFRCRLVLLTPPTSNTH